MEVRGHGGGLVAKLPAGEASHRISAAPQVEVASVVVLEGNGSPVIAVAIGLNDDALAWPQKVNRPASDANVHLGQRDAVAPTKLQKIPLQVTARSVEGHAIVKPQSRCLRLANRPPELPSGHDAAKIVNGSGGRRDRDPQPPGSLRSSKRPRPVKLYARSPSRPSAGGSGYMHRTLPVTDQVPQGRGAQVAEDCPGSTRENGCHASSLSRNRAMANRIDASMQAKESSGLDPIPHGVLVQPQVPQLANRGHAMLPSCNLGHAQVDWVEIVAHIATKSTQTETLPSD